MPVQEMLGRMNSEEITEWKAFFIYKAEKQKPKPQTAAEADAVLRAMAEKGKKQPGPIRRR